MNNWSTKSVVACIVGYDLNNQRFCVKAPQVSKDKAFWVRIKDHKITKLKGEFSPTSVDEYFQDKFPLKHIVTLENLSIEDEVDQSKVYAVSWVHNASQTLDEKLAGSFDLPVGIIEVGKNNKESVNYLQNIRTGPITLKGKTSGDPRLRSVLFASVWSEKAFNINDSVAMSMMCHKLNVDYDYSLALHNAKRTSSPLPLKCVRGFMLRTVAVSYTHLTLPTTPYV